MNDIPDTSKKDSPQRFNFLGIGLSLLLVTAAFFSGLQIGTSDENRPQLEAGLFSLFAFAPSQPEEADMTEFWRVWELMEKKFVSATTTDSLSVQERIEGAISGLVRSYGDPYTIFLPPTDASSFEESISGNFGGVGMEVGLREGMVSVISPLPDTPASRAGIVSGDIIIKIDEASTEGMDIDEAVKLIRGEKGTEVVLTLFREGELEFLEIPVVRDIINIPTVKTEQKGDVFIISLYSFNALSESKMNEALREYINSDAIKMIIDLRGNPGGFLQSSVAIASHFIPAGKPVVRESFGGDTSEQVYRSQGKLLGTRAPKEMVVLVDRGSASASEILAGALQEHGIATLMGAQTFGKGSVQELVDLPNGSSLKVTIARWLTPNGVSISDGGLTPDILVDRTPQQIIAEEDPQLEAALAWLAGDKTVGTSTKEVAQ